MSHKKYFSTNNENSYNDYLKVKKGKEMIKKSISENKYNLNTFINYETFLILTKTFYENLNNKYKIAPPTSINDSNTSFLNYKSILNHLHNDDCEHCKKCPIEEIVNCKYVSNILYPYGESIVKNDPLEKIYYPHNINLNLYCKKCPSCIEHCETKHYKKCDTCDDCCDESWKSTDNCNPFNPCNSVNPCHPVNPCNPCNTNSCSCNPYNPCNSYNNGCGKTKPLFFKEKQVCKCCPKSKSKCLTCRH